jgi:hypothetical protein
MLLQPVNDETIWRKQPQDTPVFHSVQRSDPGVELLLGQFFLQTDDAAVPEICLSLQRGPR